MSESKAQAVTDNDFDGKVLKAEKPVLVDCWAEWCGPCKSLLPIVDELAEEFAGRVDILKMDADANPDTPPAYGIRSLPTLLLFKGGEVIGTVSGVKTKSELVDFINEKIA